MGCLSSFEAICSDMDGACKELGGSSMGLCSTGGNFPWYNWGADSAQGLGLPWQGKCNSATSPAASTFATNPKHWLPSQYP
jgi:hypothetical protein